MLYPPVTVALARRVDTLPTAPGWSFEPKLDGHRVVLFRLADEVVLQSRTGRIVTSSYPDLAAAAAALPGGTVLDGETVVITEGRPDFGAVQARAASSPARAARLARELPASYLAFDALAVGGQDQRGRPYTERRRLLVELLAGSGPPIQAVPATQSADAAAAMLHDLAAVLEGVVCKRLTSHYVGGRRDWLKVKHGCPRR